MQAKTKNQRTINMMKDNISVPVDIFKLADACDGNVYKSLIIVGKRANQLTVEMKEDLMRRLSEFAPSYDNLEEVSENKEQIEISKHYERKAKTTHVALDEFLDGKVQWKDI